MAHLFITKGSLVLITTSMHLTTPGMGERITTTNRGLGMRVYTPSMRVPTSARDVNSP